MPLETITVTITGANPQTKTLQVYVDPNTGSGSGTISYVGSHGGQDTVKATATIANTGYASNSAFVAWQATNGRWSLITPVALYGYSTANHETYYPPLTQIYGPTNFSSVVINQPINNTPIVGVVSPDGNSGEYKLVPPHLNDVKADGTAITAAGTSLTALANTAFLAVFKGQFVIAAAGTYTFYCLADDAWGLYIGQGATRVAGTYNPNFSDGGGGSPTSFDGIPLIATRNTAASSPNPVDYAYIKFPAPGIYNFRLWLHNNQDAQVYLQPTWAAGQSTVPGYQPPVYGGVLKPIPLQANAPATAPSGNLQLSGVVTTPYIEGQTVTLNVVVSGIKYTTKPYIPVYEGVAGKIYLYNDPTLNQYTFQTYNGQAVDKTAAASNAFSLTGSNGSWQGRLSVIYDSTAGQFELSYNGNTFDPHVDISTLTITAEDIAWYNSSTKSFDTFTVSGGLGGNQYQIEVDYMVKPGVASVSPLQVAADGTTKTFTVTLTKPFSPQQQGANNTGNVINTPVFTAPGCTVGTPAAVLDASGWLTGWNVPITVPNSSSTSSVALGMTLTGKLTYLSGDTFMTAAAVTYIPTGTIATLTLTGSSYTPPSISAFSVSPKTGTAPNYTITSGATETLTATVVSAFNNSTTCSFWRQQHGTTTRVNMGNGTLSNSYTSGGKYYKVFTFSQVDTNWYTTNDLGAQAHDSVSGLNSNLYFDSSTYTLQTSTTTSGGGSGCPAVEMYLSQYAQVSDAAIGMSVTALVGNTTDYYGDAAIATELAQVEKLDISAEPCYHLVAENGAEVIISASTPVPTRETIEALRESEPGDVLPFFANQIRSGMHVITDVGNGPEWSMLVETAAVGVRHVARLYCGGRNFAAGVKPGKYIFTHNVLPIVK